MNKDSAKDRLFAVGEAGSLVRSIRTKLAEASAAGPSGKAHASKEADTLLADLLTKLKPRVDKYARAYLPYGSSALLEDFATAIDMELIRRVKHPGDAYASMEHAFNQAFEHCAISALRKAKREAELTSPVSSVQAFSLDEVVSSTPESDGQSLVDAIEDPEAEAQIKRREFAIAFRQVSALLPSKKHVDVCRLRLIEGLGWAEIAAGVKVSDETARKYCEQGKMILKSWLLEGR